MLGLVEDQSHPSTCPDSISSFITAVRRSMPISDGHDRVFDLALRANRVASRGEVYSTIR